MSASSFSAAAKAELCRVPPARDCCAAAEAYGALLCSNRFTAGEIRFITACPELAQRLPRLWKRAFGFGFDRVREGGKSGRSVLGITDPEKIRTVFRRYGYEPDELLSHHINLGVLEEDHCRAAFFRGAFLAGGSVTDPEKRIRLELVTDHRSVCGEAGRCCWKWVFLPGTQCGPGIMCSTSSRARRSRIFSPSSGRPGAPWA